MAGSSTDRRISRRMLEISTALAVGLFGAIVSGESLTHDIGWNENGPGPGYFPFRVGLLLTGAAAALLVQNVRVVSPAVFVTGDELRRSLGVFWPAAVLVVAMFPFGCYVPSGVYLAWMMRRQGGYGWGPSAAYGFAVTAGLFVVFDLWFRVPLAKGPMEAVIGIY